MNDLAMAAVHCEFGHNNGFLRKPMLWKLLYFVNLKSEFLLMRYMDLEKAWIGLYGWLYLRLGFL